MMLELNSPTLRSRKDIKIEASFDFNDEPSDESKARTSPKIIPRKPRHRAKSPPPGVSKKSSPKSVSSPISSPKSVSTPKGSPKCDSRKNSFEEISSVEEEILLNDPTRKVSFHSTAFVVLIPTIQEYYDAGLAEMLWWNEKDFHGFKTCAASEVKEYMKTVSPHASPSNKQAVKSSMDARKALKLYFQQFFDPKDVSNTKFNQLMLSVQMQQQYEQQQKFLQQQQLLKQQKEQAEKKELPPPPQPAVVEETKTEPPPAAVAPLQIQVENLDHSPVVPAQRHDSICGGKPRVQHLHHLSDDQTVLENRNSLNELETEPTMPSLPFPVLSSEATVCKPEGEGSDSLAALKRMMNGVGILSIVLQQN